MKEEKIDAPYEAWLSKYGGYANGMTLRDYFAASLVSSGHIFKSISEGDTPALVAEQAYMMADAMLEARK